MILFRKRTIRLVPFYLLYMAAVLAASSLYGLYAAESEEIVAQVFGDRVYCYLLVPPFIWTISTIDGSTKKPSFIRMKSRNQYLLFLLLQQYLFAVIYLTTWFSMIYILAIWHGERYLFVDMFSSYIRYLLSFFLLANISEMLKRTKNKMLSDNALYICLFAFTHRRTGNSVGYEPKRDNNTADFLMGFPTSWTCATADLPLQ